MKQDPLAGTDKKQTEDDALPVNGLLSIVLYDIVIRRLYDECFKESIILGVFMGEDFCGLAEIYGYREATHKASIGCRFLERYWGKGIATEAVGALVRYLTQEAGIEIITASTMVTNKTITHVVEKNNFLLVVSGAEEDWGYAQPTPANKWVWLL